MVEPNPSVLRLGLFVRGAERTSQLSRKMSSHPGLRVSVTADSLSEVKAALTAGRMDVSVCGTEFMEIAARFHSRAEPDEPRITRLFLVARPTVGSIVHGVHTGFDNYLTEDDSVEVWHDTIRRTVDGSASLRADPLWERVGEPIDMTSLRFDERPEMERNIIELLAEGLTNEQIAAVLHLSRQTVRNKVFRLMEASASTTGRSSRSRSTAATSPGGRTSPGDASRAGQQGRSGTLTHVLPPGTSLRGDRGTRSIPST